MPPGYEAKMRAAPTGRVTSTAATAKSSSTTGPYGKAALQSRLGNSGLQALLMRPEILPTTVQAARIYLISKEEEARPFQQVAEDRTRGFVEAEHPDAGHTDIYDAERHARWMYRLTREFASVTGELVGAAQEAKGLIKGGGLLSTVMDLWNNNVGRQAVMRGDVIPNRHRTRTLAFIDRITGQLKLNLNPEARIAAARARLAARARGKVTEAAAYAAHGHSPPSGEK